MSATATTIANDRVAIDLGEDGVAEVRFVRGDKMNALDHEMFQRIIEAGHALQRMKGLRAVVLSGEGRAGDQGETEGKKGGETAGFHARGPRLESQGSARTAFGAADRDRNLLQRSRQIISCAVQ